jgi:hypothetical protein
VLSTETYKDIRETLGHELFWLLYTEEGFTTDFMKHYNEAYKTVFMKLSQNKLPQDELIYACLYLKEIMSFRTRNLLEFSNFERSKIKGVAM